MAPLLPQAPPAFLPCPASAGWEVVASTTLPRREGRGRPAGGFSAAVYLPEADQLWLLSDAPSGSLSGFAGLRGLSRFPPRPLFVRPLVGTESAPLPEAMDGEGLVLWGTAAWVASEGRRTAERPAQLLRFDARSGRLKEALPLPGDWQPAAGRGLAANGGPESLALLEGSPGPPALLMGAEQPLLQDAPDRVRLLQWPLTTGGSVAAPSPRGSLALPAGAGWGLTDLLVLPSRSGPPRLLALLRRFEPPAGWSLRLAVYPLPARADGPPPGPPTAPVATWDLIATGLAPDNWEAMTPGPTLADGRPSLLLASDDNFSALQDNHLVQLAPRRTAPCPPLP